MTGIDTMYKQIWPSSASYLDVIQKYTGKNTKKIPYSRQKRPT